VNLTLKIHLLVLFFFTSLFTFSLKAQEIQNETSIEVTPIQYHYDCVSKESGGEYVKLIVNATGKKELVVIDNEPADMDIKYTSKTKNKTRYVYRKNTEGTNLIVIENSLRNGAPTGLMALQWRGDAFSQTLFECTRE
jgi:hypothetical protein